VRTTNALLARVDWHTVNARVQREQRNREVYVPPISLFRWWARRPHALIGSLIDAACADGSTPVIADPFSGGGTVALEAARRGLPIYAQDLHPWAITGLATALDGIDPDVLAEGVTTVLSALEPLRQQLYGTSCPTHGADSELIHVFWVRRAPCPSCSSVVYLYPYSLLSLASRMDDEGLAYFGCRACGAVSRQPTRSARKRRCTSCATVLTDPDVSLLADRVACCAKATCGKTFPAFAGNVPDWQAVLVQRSCQHEGRSLVHLDLPTKTELSSPTKRLRLPAGLSQRIPPGVETSILRRAGFKRWRDLYPPRQLSTLLGAAEAVDLAGISEATRSRLLLAICGAAEMAGFASRWDRYYPKAFEAIANHRFAALGFACETNLLGERGRGTLRRRFAASITSARWARQEITTKGMTRVRAATSHRVRFADGTLLACGSSERQLASKGSVDLVLTDPPYFDDVQYAELAGLFLTWAQSLSLLPSGLCLDLRAEAVVNAVRGAGVDEYRALLTRIFIETRRTLRVDGRLVLTFHNTDVRAWWAMSRALYLSGFVVAALAVAQAENATDHSKQNRGSFTKDVVLECRPSTSSNARPRVILGGTDSQERELRAAGWTVATCGALDLDRFSEALLKKRGDLRYPRIHIAKQPTRVRA
jgi:putative DNA methylase